MCLRNSATIAPLTATGRNLPTEILFAVSRPFLSQPRPRILIAGHFPASGGLMASSCPMAGSASPLREIRTGLGLSQAECATALGVALETFRIWDAGRRPAPEAIVGQARTLKAELNNLWRASNPRYSGCNVQPVGGPRCALWPRTTCHQSATSSTSGRGSLRALLQIERPAVRGPANLTVLLGSRRQADPLHLTT
jgi:DNA-binding XRE family transcriptional regulator